MNTNRASLGVLVATALTLLGCGKADDQFARADASGIVTLDGEPLTEGVVYFIPTNGTTGPKSFASIADGKFTASGELSPIVGSHRIEIQSTDDGGLTFDDEEAMVEWVAQGRKPLNRIVIPPIYNQNSVLTADVKADGPNEFKFELSSKRRR